MSPPAALQSPQVGESVLCDGEFCEIKELAQRFDSNTGQPVKALRYESDQYRHYGKVTDLIFCPDLNCWYLWGRCLSPQQTAVVVELRDRGLLKARATRNPGMAPAAGEHHQLYLALFKGVDHEYWPAALSKIRSGQILTDDVAARLGNLAERFKSKLPYGFADRDADDSRDEVIS